MFYHFTHDIAGTKKYDDTSRDIPIIRSLGKIGRFPPNKLLSRSLCQVIQNA